MLLQTQPNNWSCLPTAFAMVLDVPVALFIEQLGHDGSQQHWERYRLAWHIQEIAKVCYDYYGVCVTQLEAVTLAAPTPGYDPHEQTYDLSEYYGADAGVAGVTNTRGIGHALAFSKSHFYNPSSGRECSLKDYQVHTVWLLGLV
jgi:hypothetical protein